MPDEETQKKSERLHMLISPEELAAIEDWRFKNRIGTRADAVRRLTQIALKFDDQADALEIRASRLFEELTDKGLIVAALYGNGEEEKERVLKLALDLIGLMAERFSPIVLDISTLAEQARYLRSPSDFKKIVEYAHQVRMKQIDRWQEVSEAYKALAEEDKK